MPAKRIWAEQLPTELPCKKKILAKAINNKIQAQSCAPQNSGSKPSAALGVRQRKKNKKAKIRRARQARQAAKLAAAAEPPALRPAAQLDEI